MRRNSNIRAYQGYQLEQWPSDGKNRPIIGDNPAGVKVEWWVFRKRNLVAGPFDLCSQAKAWVRNVAI